MQDYLLGLDIGGTKCAVILGRSQGDRIEILDRLVFATETARGPEYALGLLEATARQMLEKHSLTAQQVAGLGISCGGPLDSARGLVLGPPNLPGWDEVPITSRFQRALGIPTYLQNDANACALAEWRWGAGQGTRHMIFLTFGTGLGAGLVLDGRIYPGIDDLGGEVGHVRLAEDGPEGFGKRGSFEGFCSGGGLRRLALEKISDAWARGETVGFCPDEGALESVTARTVAEAARSGDPLAREVYEICGHYLGRGLAILIDILNPERIVIGSIYARCEDLLRPPSQRVIEQEAIRAAARRCQVVPAALGEQIGDYAALAVARMGAGED